MDKFLTYLILSSFLFLPVSYGAMDLTGRDLDLKKIRIEDNKTKNIIRDSFFDPSEDYSKFPGRITDRNKAGNVVKVFSENGNVKFLRAGDVVYFKVANKDTKQCKGYVRSSERQYFVMYITNLSRCWNRENYFRRGTMFVFASEILSNRVQDASVHRLVLLKRRSDFYNQLNEINHYLWTYDQQKIQLALDFDKKILELERAKERSMQSFLLSKQDKIELQHQLAKRLDTIDMDLEQMRIEKVELYTDRWAADHDLSPTLNNRPQKYKKN